MTKIQKLKAIKNNEYSGDIPFFRPILMHFATNFIGKNYGEFSSDYKTLVDANIRCMEHFDTDAVGLISDPYRETAAFGAKIIFHKDRVPECSENIVKTINDVIELKNPDVYKSERTLDRINGVKEFRKILGQGVPIIGWIEGPFAEACDLVGTSEMLMNTIVDPDFCKAIFEKCMITAKDFALAQIEAGCDVIGIGDAICSQISAEYYHNEILPLHKKLVQFIQSKGAMVKLHICGNITHLLPDLKNVAPDILDIDWMVDMDNAFNLLGPDIIRCGNLDPVAVILNSTPEQISKKTIELISKEKGRKFILSAGCEIPLNTPTENLLAMRSFHED